MHYFGNQIGKRRAGLWIGFLITGAIPCLCGVVQAADQPTWAAPEMAARTCFEAEGGPGVRVALRVELCENATNDKLPGFAAFDANGNRIPFDVLSCGDGSASVLVDPGSDSGNKTYALYYNGPNVQPSSGLSPRSEVNPVSVELNRYPVKSIPNTWAGMVHLLRMVGEPDRTFMKPGFGQTQFFDEGSEEQKNNQRFLAKMKSMVFFPQKGSYTFSIDCRDAGAVLIDGEMVVAWPGEHDGGRWKAGSPVTLDAGLHRVEVLNVCGTRWTASLGWTVPDSTNIVAVPAESAMTWREAAKLRLDLRDREVQPDFSFIRQPGYIFRGQPGFYFPVTLKNTTVALPGMKRKLHASWSFDGYGEKSGNTVHAVFTSAVPQKVTVEIDDGKGHKLTSQKTIDCRFVRQLEHSLEADIKNLPAACYPSDVVVPELWISGTLPAGEQVEVAWSIKDYASWQHTGSTNVTPSIEPVVIQLPARKAGVTAEISWNVSYKNAPIKSEDIQFLAPPFSSIPGIVSGEGLYSAPGRRLVLVAAQKAGSFNQPPVSSRNAKHGLLLTDGSGLSGLDSKDMPARAHFDDIMGRPDPVPFHYAVVPAWGDSPDALGSLLKLVQMPGIVGSFDGAVVLSPCIRDLTDSADLDRFERQIAALTDIVSTTLKKTVIWTTPPPYPGLSGRSREFAVRIRRVADARRIPVADLYSLFSGLRGEIRPFAQAPDMELSEEGRQLAARAIITALGHK